MRGFFQASLRFGNHSISEEIVPSTIQRMKSSLISTISCLGVALGQYHTHIVSNLSLLIFRTIGKICLGGIDGISIPDALPARFTVLWGSYRVSSWSKLGYEIRTYRQHISTQVGLAVFEKRPETKSGHTGTWRYFVFSPKNFLKERQFETFKQSFASFFKTRSRYVPGGRVRHIVMIISAKDVHIGRKT